MKDLISSTERLDIPKKIGFLGTSILIIINLALFVELIIEITDHLT